MIESDIRIDRAKVYESGSYTFHNFVTLPKEQLLKILEWRNHPSIRKWMYNSGEIAAQDHLRFVGGLDKRTDCYYWLVKREEEPIGVVNVTSIDWDSNTSELGYYLLPELEGEGFDFVKECMNFFFNTLGFTHFYGAVNSLNRNAILLDEFLGCNFTSSKFLEIDGRQVEFLVTENLRSSDFSRRYNTTIVEFIKYIKNNGTKRIHSEFR